LSSWSYEHPVKRQLYEFLIQKREQYTGTYDLSVQVTIPNEFQEAAPINIGVTAGVETTQVPQDWLLRCNSMDKIIVTSEFTKKSFLETVLEVKAAHNDAVKTFKGCQKPLEVVGYPIRDVEVQDISGQLSSVTTKFNFVTVAQMAPRKNLEHTISAFIEEFRDDPDVGLIIKCHAQNHSTIDKDMTEHMLYPRIRREGDRKCKIYHIHGDMTDSEMQGLIQSPKVDCYLTTTFAEGFGLPLLDAAAAGVPIIAPRYSGYLDFLYIPGTKKRQYLFEAIRSEIKEVPEHALMDGVIVPGAKWGFPDYAQTKKALRNVYENYRIKKRQAKKLQEYVVNEFSRENQLKRMCEAIRTGFENETTDWKEKMNKVQVL
jgi:glycosyltransferase involved in cell wall biosynthesis